MRHPLPSSPLGRLAVAAAFRARLVVATRAEASTHALMRYPTLHGNTVVFVAHDNLWAVPRTGGTAARLTADEGRDVMPLFEQLQEKPEALPPPPPLSPPYPPPGH